MKPQQYEVTKIIGEITKERLSASLGNEADKFIGDMKKACDGNTGNFKVGDKVYVYIYQSGGKWIYSTQLQGRDWNQHVSQKPITTLDK
ncbi:hypothetical protein HF1_09980 [Mycoplasma haemofelis str. Langford 1]|uniref:Uncharacterized protein n=1 Tax=Mycoplasma haemofelis (strain Langford 1) TaxID=941640 RepID=E8ZIN5_MYCHL|nr:hypothetical protein [Mycoplasma haemofelis]CBY93006.1 hypothetical protein HF1_09980 [Mycoplasma haemofelis str. Langford 1]